MLRTPIILHPLFFSDCEIDGIKGLGWSLNIRNMYLIWYFFFFPLHFLCGLYIVYARDSLLIEPFYHVLYGFFPSPGISDERIIIMCTPGTAAFRKQFRRCCSRAGSVLFKSITIIRWPRQRRRQR